MLVIFDHDVAEIDISHSEGQVLVEKIGSKQIPSRVFMGDGKVARLGAQLRAGGEPAAEEIGDRSFELGGVVVVLVAAKAKNAELVGFGLAHSEIDESAFCQEQLAGG